VRGIPIREMVRLSCPPIPLYQSILFCLPGVSNRPAGMFPQLTRAVARLAGMLRAVILAAMAVTVAPLPPRDDLLTLFRAGLGNAHDLLDEAKILFEARRWPRAHVLATLAHEELGKAHTCLLAVVLPADVTSEDFWGVFGDHERKLRRVQGFAELMRPGTLPPIAEVAGRVLSGSATAHDLRLRGLFVGYKKGRVLLPSAITEKAARNKISQVHAALAFADAAFPVTGFDEMLAAFGSLVEPIRTATTADPDAVAVALREAMQGRGDALTQLIGPPPA
jgi:AbiV family abortive infection protein